MSKQPSAPRQQRRLILDDLALVLRKPSAAPTLTPGEVLAVMLAGLDWAPGRYHDPDGRLIKSVLRGFEDAGYEISPKQCHDPADDFEAAVPVDLWPKEIDERVLIYVVHQNAQHEKDEAKRLAEWEGWHVGYWTDQNKGGWVWHGMLGTITHVAPLPPIPKCRADGKGGL